jgi:hypothetical protein
MEKKKLKKINRNIGIARFGVAILLLSRGMGFLANK